MKIKATLFLLGAFLVASLPAFAQTMPNGGGAGGGGGGTPANPTATAGPAAVNGSATTYMRSDSAPAVQKGSDAQFGIIESDGATITCPSGVCSLVSNVLAGTTQTVTTAQWASCAVFQVKTAAQTLTLPISSSLSAGGCLIIQTQGQSVTLAPNAADAINGGTTGVSATIASGLSAVVSKDAATANNLIVTPTTAGSTSFANPTATAGPTAVNGSASTAMRSDAAPPVQKGSNAQFGIVEGDTTTINCVTGNCSTGSNVPLLNADQIFTGTNTFGAVKGKTTTQSGTTYTFGATDCGTVVIFTNASAVTATIPASIVPASGTVCNIVAYQAGAGQVSVNGTAVSAATLVSAHSYTKTFGQYALLGMSLTTVSAVATAVVSGDGA